MKLIFNADDFGLTESVNLAIVDCFKAGVVKSTTIMMNQPGTAHAIELYQQRLIPEVGLHFTVTAGKPLSDPKDVPSLVDEDGHFLSKQALFNKSDVCVNEVALELKAQYQAAIDAGLQINHIDSHHFAGVYRPLKQGFIKAANDIGLPVRRVDNIIHGQDLLSVPTPDAFDMGFFDEGVDIDHLKAMLLAYKQKMPSGTLELMCHPSQANTEELKLLSGYGDKRIDEFEILTNPCLKLWLEENGINCVGFEFSMY